MPERAKRFLILWSIWIGGGGGGWGGVVWTCWLFNSHGSTEVIWDMTAYIGPG